ncbi:type IV secretory system conjugative DNA transfer family protein [Nocardia brasiliensis]|uniref:type IV secretory system conjugative DNA transfer family protein n=1 Tax=Nocardia brasiliensis TaxID=37326 RepID=UPI0018943666|nr:TraM recognition domain-containing protein [Nocardia brasiliensis]MBF6125534.1 TraM recognition domain-containing protein [Nocardia brasiliensis]
MIATRESRRRTKRGVGEETALLLLFVALVVLVAGVWVALQVGSWWAGLPTGGHPVAALLSVATGTRAWPWQSSVVAAGLGAVVVPLVWVGRRMVQGGSEIDAAARTMQRPREIQLARVRDNALANKRLLCDAPAQIQALKGPPLGRTVIGNIELYVPTEMCVTLTAGARTGKTMAWAIAAVLSAWGPCIATSIRPDLYRHTVYGREKLGRIWLCDLQGVLGHPMCGFWVDLLAQVESLPAARKLASFFVSGATASATQAANARVDSYFDGGAQELLALYLYAAACARGDLLHVAEWLGRDQDLTPALILRHYGHTRQAERIVESQALYARQRDGLYDMARRYLNVLSDENYAQLVTPPQRQLLRVREVAAGTRGGQRIVLDRTAQQQTHDLPEFIPADFVGSSDTLYPLSMAGADSATPLTSALVGQILEAALAAARLRPDGRLRVPLLGVLDEAANCARISELPSYYTYAGGSGVVLITILQTIEQGEDLWGPSGLKTMRAQSIEVYGGGIAAVDYLEHWVAMAGAHDVAERSRSHGAGGVNRTRTWRPEPILDVSLLAALPKDRALVRLPGYGPVVVRKIWWQNTEYKTVVEASLARFTKAASPIELHTATSEPGDDGRRP